MAKWQSFSDQDRTLLYLLECLTSIAQVRPTAMQTPLLPTTAPASSLTPSVSALVTWPLLLP